MYAFRQAELVGKRFLCVREKNTLRPNSRSRRVANPLDYQWKVGVIRVCSEKDFNHPELKVLVEYDDEEWTTREWLKIHDGSWRLFLVEKSMVWSQRPDPSNPKRPLLWPALTFVPLVDKHGLSDEERPVPVEFVGDHERAFLRSDEFRPYGQDDDALHPVLRNNVAVVHELQGWQLLQKSQSILMKGPFTLTGFRVKVYRQSCRQWFSAVITAHDIVSRELSVMDDTVLQTHRVDPTLVQVILLANEAELDSLLRGELNVVRVLPMRQHRHSQVVITAPLTTHSTSGSLSSSPSTWQLYSGLSQDNNTNNLANITTPVYQSALASTSARLNTACSSSNSHGIRHGKERRKSTETRNRTPSACKITRSNSNSPVPSNDTLKPASQTPQSSFTSSVATPLMSNHLTAPHSHNQLSNKTSPPDATISPAKNSSSSSSVGSPPSSFPKKSPLKQQMSPKTSPPSVLSYNSSPASNASMSAMGSPFRAHPFCSSPDLSSVASMASPMAGISHMGMCSPGHAAHSRSQGPHPLYPHTMGLNISPNQLYALQCQQQQQMPAQEQQEYLTKLRHQHYQSLLQQYQMHCYQLQLMVQQQELIQQMPLTAEQQHILAEHYNQLLYQFQCAQIFQQLAAVTQEEQLSNFHSVEGDIHSLPERIQQRLREAQQQQKQWLQELTPRLEPKQLHTLFTCLQQKSMTAKEIEQLYSLLLQQQQEQKRLTHAQRETPECEQQKQKLQQCHQQYQEHLQKFLQLPKSPSSTQVVETKQEPKQEPKPEASCSSSSPSRNASPSTLSPSPSSSTFTVHHLPSVKEKASSPKGISEDKSENEPSAGVSSSESPKLTESKNVEEIELTSTTTTGDGQSLLEKLLQHHLKAVENNRKESSTKTKKSKVEEKRSKRRRRSTESKDDSLAHRDSEMIKCSPSVSFSSEGDSTNVISSSLTVGDGPNSSSNKLSLEKREEVLDNKNFHKNSSFGEVDNNHGKEGSGMAVAIKEGNKTASKTEGETFTPEKERNSVKSKPNEQSADTRKGVFYEDAAPWIPDEATHDVPQTVRLSSNVTESIESFTGARKDFKKESSTVLDGRGSGEMFVNDTTSKNPNIVTLEGGKMVAQGRNDPIVPKVSSTNDKKEMIQGTTVKISKKGSTKSPSKDSSNVQSLSSSCNSATDLGTPSVNVKDRKDSERMDVESKEIDTSVAKQKPSLSSEVTPLFTKSFLSMSSSNSADHNGELFSGEGLKTYLRKVTPNKRKLGTEDNFVEDNSIAKKALTMGNKESPETDRLKDIIPNNSKVELAKRLNKKFANSHLEEKTVQSQHQLSVSSSERTKASRKNSADANNVLTKRSRREEIMSSDVDDARHKTDVKLQLKDNITREEDKNRVDSVSFVADQVVNEISINHSPTAKDAPGDQFGAVKVNSERQNSRSKERIREITSKKKELKSREERNKERQQRGVGLPSVCVKEPDTADSLETVVDSVLDEEIALIYKADEEQDNESLLATSETNAIVKTEERPVTPVKEKEKEKGKGVTVSSGKEAAPPRGRGRPRKKEVKKIVDESDSTSPSSEQYFLQDRICASLPDLPKCRDCREHPSQRNGLDCCRFNSFRRLRKKKNGTILSAGFQLPEDAAAEDFLPWVAQEKVDRLDKKTSLYILYNIGDQFCSVMQEEKKAITCVETDGKQVTVAYKRAVQGVREMCDVCATTIFNVHWVCHRCGFGVCLDCYKLRVQERERQSGLAGKRVFEFKWVMCCPGICHQPKFLSVAQIIPKTVLSDLGDELHRAREVWKISKRCPCKEIDDDDDDEDNDDATETGLSNEELTQVEENGVDACKETSDTIVKTEPLSISSSQTAGAGDSESSFEDDVNLICDESLGIDSPADQEQEWLTEEKRRNHFYKKAGFGLVEAKPQKAKKVSSGLSLLMDYSSSREVSPCDSPVKDVKPAAGMFNFSLGGNGGSFSGLDLLALACERNGEDFSMDNTFRLNAESKTEMDTTNFNPLNKRDDNRTTDVPGPVATTCESTSAEYSEEVRSHAVAPVLDSPEAVPHSWLCDGRLLRLHDPRHPGNLNAFEARWKKGEPVLVSQVDKYLNLDIWTPKAFGEEFGSEISDVVNCRNGVVVERFKVGDFWQGFESIKDRPLDSNGEPMLLKLKDWPPKDDFSEKLPTRFEDLMNNVPLPEYTRRDGSRNLVSRLPDFFVKPDLGPKMYNAYGSAACPKEGTTNLHLDMSDAVNIMVYVGVPKDEGAGDKERQDAIRAVDEACDESQRTRVRNETARIGALWHIYAAEDADKIRDCLRAVAKERKMKYSAHHDPIHDQCFYLDHEIRQRLKGEYGVEGWAICQCLGDSVFIPAGAPHQVRNLYSCVKVAEDFVSPERIDHCFRMTQEFRHLSDKHTNHEDKLQVKNIIFHAVKDALHSLKYHEQESTDKTQNSSDGIH